MVLLHMVLGEMVPKNLALAAPERAALVLVLLAAADLGLGLVQLGRGTSPWSRR